MQVPASTARKLRGGIDRPGAYSRAFECSRCQVVIYEDEFIEGEFVPPPQRRLALEIPVMWASVRSPFWFRLVRWGRSEMLSPLLLGAAPVQASEEAQSG